MSMVSDAMNHELKQIIDTVFKDFVFDSDTTNIYKILNINEN